MKQLDFFHCDFTAERGQEPFMLSIAKTGNTRVFLFHVAPDMFINKSTCVLTSDDNIESDSEDSIDCYVIECNTQVMTIDANPLLPYKLGELVAQLHFLLVSKAIRRLLKGKEIGNVTSSGLLIDKQVGGIIVDASATTSSGFQVNVQDFSGSILTPITLCSLLKKLINKN